MSDEIYGIGVGTGDPEELTFKAVRLIKESDVLILPRKDKAKCRAYQIKTQAVIGWRFCLKTEPIQLIRT